MSDPKAPPAPTADVDKKVFSIFAGGFVLVAFVFLLLSLAGTNADLLGSPSDGAVNWMEYVRQLPVIDPSRVPGIYLPGVEDPLTWDTRPQGPPTSNLPPESKAAPGSTPATVVPQVDQEAIEKARAAAAKKAKIAAEVKDILKAGDKLLRTNRYPQAKETYLRAAKLDAATKPVIAEKFFDKGKLNERKRAWSRAQTLYRICLHFMYENSKYHTALAETSEALGKKSKAKEHRRLAKKFKAKGK